MLKVSNIKKRYGEFLLNASIEVRPGYVTGLVGPNGAGKSTVFKAILDLIHLDGGNIEVFGKDVKMLKEYDKQRFGVALSDSGFSDYLTIHDITYILKNMYDKYDNSEFLNRCKQFDLPTDKRLMDFSTGMKAKLKLLIALSHQAELLILDEPTVGLDVIARDEMLGLLRSYLEEDEKRSILISSHISSDLEGLCDDLYVIHRGSIVFHEETDNLLDSYALLKLSQEQYDALDKQYIIKYKKKSYGYCCLTDQKQFYAENYPEVVIEKGNIDNLIFLMIGGTDL